VVSIKTQKVTLFSNGVRVAQRPVSTRVPGHPTPMGVFSVIEKNRYHHSNIYSGAPMPYMQRTTGVGNCIGSAKKVLSVYKKRVRKPAAAYSIGRNSI
jgi:hypothetical protein